MPSASAQTLKNLLQHKNSLPVASSTTTEPSSGEIVARPQRETKSAALANKVWLNDSSQRRSATGTAVKRAVDSNDAKTYSQPKLRKISNQVKELEDDVDDDQDNDQSFTPDEDEDTEEDEEAAFQQVKVVGGSGKVKRTQTSGPQKDLNNNDSYILPLDIDDAKSDISSVVDTSMLPFDEEDNGNTDRPTQTVRKSWAKKSLSRNAKYTAERPTIVTATASKGDHPGGLSKSFQTDLNSGWDASTHLVYPNQQRTISMTAQEQSIKDVLREAILLATGLAIFQNAFALSDRQLVDSRNSILSAAASLKYPQIAHRFEQDRGFAKHLTNYVTGRIGNMRGQVKEVAQKVVPSLYGIHQVPIEDGQRKRFVTDSTTTRTSEPYLHPAIITVLHKFFFHSRKSLGRRFQDTFLSTVDSDNAKKIPQAMLALVSVAIFAALKEWEQGLNESTSREFVSANFSEQYDLHILFLGTRILKTDGSGKGKYHALMARLYREAVSGANVSDADLAGAAKLPALDFDGMEE
ncbi:hypothetical protein DFH05DRAFT_1461488 [Lentinula detonsa]|uniref:DUF6532 domain-containing protein n=1 Tax=Lentinula detonsa TaxID=2804962 RepID=A0A9W8NWN9_9AGAR|nr:hypothetical protein DFH05DRAFT_1461488 [Lentinula detonsa]